MPTILASLINVGARQWLPSSTISLPAQASRVKGSEDSGGHHGAQNVETQAVIEKIMLDSSWADGLRGIAAVFVMFTHITLSFARYIVLPGYGPEKQSDWMQRPILRLVGQGPAWVACFIILSGFVNSLKPIKLAKTGQRDAALSNLSTSAFRRSFRLVLPAIAATVISWIVCQCGGYEVARYSNTFWLSITSPPRSSSLGGAFADLASAIVNTWTFDPKNIYDQPQWTLLYFLVGSMITFMTLVITVNLTPRYRALVCIGGMFVGTNWDIRLQMPMVGMGMMGGMLIAELHQSSFPLRYVNQFVILSPPLFLLSLFLMSYPNDFYQNAGWSNMLYNLARALFAPTIEVGRLWPTLGALLLCFTITMSPHLRRAFSHPILLWLGKISFPLYLLHGTFLRTILAWILFIRQPLVDMEDDMASARTMSGPITKKFPMPAPAVIMLALPVFGVSIFTAAHFWTLKIEPYFGSMTKWAEDIMFGKTEAGQPASPLPTVRPAIPSRQD